MPKYNHTKFNHVLVSTSGYCIAEVMMHNVGKQMKYVVSEHFADMNSLQLGRLQNVD